MTERQPPHPPPSDPGGDGVRVVPKTSPPRRLRAWGMLAIIATVVGVVWWMLVSGPEPVAKRAVGHVPSGDASTPVGDGRSRAAQRAIAEPATESTADPATMPNDDPDDLANYFQPGDAEPSGADVIKGLQAAGVRTGLGAFNPPGTSPPLEGLAVPADFQLPDGYVRHHQVTDEGVPIEPILMFAPGFTLYDASGRPIAMPDNGVVPPELAPPGLPLRWVRIGKP